MGTPYDKQFFQHMDDDAVRSARVVVPMLIDLFHPTSVLDVGSGNGGWAAEFATLGVTDLLCVDGDYVNRQSLRVPNECFREFNLSQPLELDRRFDLAICLEVAEHLPASAAETIVGSLVRHADIVVFSAAIPGQGGTHHVNEQWPGYWADMFHAHGYRCFDSLRWPIWHEADVSWWYKQNTLVYLNHSAVDTFASNDKLMQAEVMQPPGVIHPDVFRAAVAELDAIRTLSNVPRLPWTMRAMAKSAQASALHHGRKVLGKPR